jgi:hypothetical protein
LSSLLECTIFLVRRIRSSTGDHAVLLADPDSEESDQLNGLDSTKRLVGEQFGRVYDELTAQQLKVQPGVAAKLIAQALVSLERIDRGALLVFYVLCDCVAVYLSDHLPRTVRCCLGLARHHYEEATADT